jgi:hypothetical protein
VQPGFFVSILACVTQGLQYQAMPLMMVMMPLWMAETKRPEGSEKIASGFNFFIKQTQNLFTLLML